jgi:hypothetical protein
VIFALSLAWGKTLDEVLEITAEEFYIWCDYYGQTPFGDDGEWHRNANLSAMVASFGGKANANDFLPTPLKRLVESSGELVIDEIPLVKVTGT